MGMSFALISLIIPLLIFAALAALTFPVIWRTVTPPRKGVKVPSCEKCRYPVGGHGSMACPECGADLRLTGIITRPMEMRRRGHLFGALLAWTFLVLLIAYVGVALFWITIGSSAMVAATTTTSTTSAMVTGFTPVSTAYRGIDVSQPYSTPGASFTMSLKLNDGSEHKLEVDYSAGTATMTNAAGLETMVLVDEKMIPAWFASAGLPTDDLVVAAEMKDIQKVTDYTGAGGWNLGGLRLNKLKAGVPTYATTTPTTTTTTTTTPTYSGWSALSVWTVPAILGGILLVWILGIVAIVLRRRKLMREANAADAGSAKRELSAVA